MIFGIKFRTYVVIWAHKKTVWEITLTVQSRVIAPLHIKKLHKDY